MIRAFNVQFVCCFSLLLLSFVMLLVFLLFFIVCARQTFESFIQVNIYIAARNE